VLFTKETPEGSRQLRRHRHRLNNNIKIDLQEWDGDAIHWIDLAQDRDM
jgi:hypothetical protein